MTHPSTWQQLITQEAPAEVYMPRAFRPSRSDCLQFVDDDRHEYLAVHTLSPYGEIDTLPAEAQAALLEAEEQGKDYTLVPIPGDILTMKQATLGNGIKDVLDLKESYHRMGRLVGYLSRVAVTPPSLSDFGMRKRTGEIVLLPPFEITAPHTPLSESNMEQSITRTLTFLPRGVCAELIDEVEQGIGETR